MKNSFKAIYSFISGDVFEQNKKNLSEMEKKAELNKKVDKLLENNLLITVLEMLNYGYILSDSQKDILYTKLSDNPLESLDIYEALLKHQYSLPEDLIKREFFSDIFNNKVAHYLNKDDEEKTHYPCLVSLYKEKFQDKGFCKDIFNLWKNEVKKLSTLNSRHFRDNVVIFNTKDKKLKVERFLLNLNSIILLKDQDSLIMKGGSLEELLDICEDFNKIVENIVGLNDKEIRVNYFNKLHSFLNSINHKVKIYQDNAAIWYKNEIIELLDTAKDLFTNNYLETKTIHNIIEESKQFNINELSDKSIAYLRQINEIYHKVSKENLSTFQKEDIDKLYNVLIPSIIKKFASMDKEYRLTLKNAEGKNSYELVEESLKEIYEKFERIYTHINEDKLSELSVSNRYTKRVVI